MTVVTAQIFTPPVTDSFCGGPYCYGTMAPDLEAFDMEYSELVEMATVNYVEDPDEIDGFDLNSATAAGFTYVAELLANDIDLDVTSVLGQTVASDGETILAIENGNTPWIDFDSIYNFRGIDARARLVVGTGGGHNGASGYAAAAATNDEDDKFLIDDRDFRRQPISGRGYVSDARNDDNRIISQLTVAWHKLHNDFIDQGLSYDEARGNVTQEWQAVVLYDLLPAFVDPEVLAEVSSEDSSFFKLYTGELKATSAVPIEFATAAFRLRHSRARGQYVLNNATDPALNNTPARLYDVGYDNEPILFGRSPLPDRDVIDWSHFFGPTAQMGRVTDMLYSGPMLRTPVPFVNKKIIVYCNGGYFNEHAECPITVDDPLVRNKTTANTALLDLLQGQTQALSGGIAFATYARDVLNCSDVTVLTMDQMKFDNVFGLPDNYNASDVPLLWYFAFESIFEHNGQFLGKLGSRILAETIYGLVENTPSSILGTPAWTSKVTNNSSVSMIDILRSVGFA